MQTRAQMKAAIRILRNRDRSLAALLRAEMRTESVVPLLRQRTRSADGAFFLVDSVIEVNPEAYAAQAHEIALVALCHTHFGSAQ